jgi:hypothetical protein
MSSDARAMVDPLVGSARHSATRTGTLADHDCS